VYACMYNFLAYQIFILGRLCLLLFKIDNVKQKTNKIKFVGGTGLKIGNL
jgi:hypothetical protein